MTQNRFIAIQNAREKIVNMAKQCGGWKNLTENEKQVLIAHLLKCEIPKGLPTKLIYSYLNAYFCGFMMSNEVKRGEK